MSIMCKDGTRINCTSIEKDEENKMLFCDDFWIIRLDEIESIIVER